MRIIDAISEADMLRPNAIDDEQKARWLMTLETEYAELTGSEVEFETIDFDQVLIMKAPHDQSYVRYLAAMIDDYNQDTGLYANDMEMANAAVDAAKAYYIRHNRPARESNWKSMPAERQQSGFDPLDLND